MLLKAEKGSERKTFFAFQVSQREPDLVGLHFFPEQVLHVADPDRRFDQFERFFWFTVEFGLVETEVGRRIFGAGILSSKAESDYALSEAPEVLDFSIEAIVRQDYRIDQFQHRLFLLRSPEQLYESLADVEACIKTKDPFPLTPILQR